jgi:heme-degrading monooxygenase HmoA
LIIRVLRGRVETDRVADFHDRAREALTEACPGSGCAWAKMGRQIHADHSEDVVIVTAWATMDALYEWIGGPDLLGTPMRGGGGDMFAYFDVQHYESFERNGHTDLSASLEAAF